MSKWDTFQSSMKIKKTWIDARRNDKGVVTHHMLDAAITSRRQAKCRMHQSGNTESIVLGTRTDEKNRLLIQLNKVTSNIASKLKAGRGNWRQT